MAEASRDKRMETIFDWRAAFIAGSIASFIYLLGTALSNALEYGNWAHSAQIITNHISGDQLNDPSHINQGGPWLLGLVLHFVGCVGSAIFIAYLVHEFGLLVGIVGGAVFGVCIYVLHYYAAAPKVEWLYGLTGQYSLYLHALYGALAGGIYEKLERARYIAKTSKGGA